MRRCNPEGRVGWAPISVTSREARRQLLLSTWLQFRIDSGQVCKYCISSSKSRASITLADLDARPWDFQAEECSLRACVDRFNTRCYGFDTGEHDDDDMQPVDNNLQSLLGQKFELSDDFKKNYEKWLDREVFSTPVNWDQLCTCE